MTALTYSEMHCFLFPAYKIKSLFWCFLYLIDAIYYNLRPLLICTWFLKKNGWRLWTFVFSFCHLNFCQSRGNWPNFMFDNFWGRWTNLHEGLMSRKPFGTTFANIIFLAYQLLIENWVLSRNMMPWNIWTFSSLLGKPSWRLDEPWTILYTSTLGKFFQD